MDTKTNEQVSESSTGGGSRKQWIAGALFLIVGLYLSTLVPTIEVAWVTGFLLLTIFLFAFEVVGVDVAAITVMVLLGLTSLLAPAMGLQQGLVDSSHLFDGFSSNAVISIIAVMIIGAGLDKTGMMSKVATFILKVGGTTESRIIPIISSTVGVISSFMQNVGAAALFLPVVSRISARSGLPMSRLLMPMGFCAILGGTVTMVGSSPLILLNDLILTSNTALPETQQMETWSLFSVTPIGIALLATGILYFVIAGRFVLPSSKSKPEGAVGSDAMGYFHDLYDVDFKLFELVVPKESSLIGKQLDDVESDYRVRIIGSKYLGEESHVGPGSIARDTAIIEGMVLGVIAAPKDLNNFVAEHQLKQRDELRTFSESLSSSKAGIAEVLIRPGSNLIGKSARDVWMRKVYGLAMIALHRNGETKREGDHIRDMPFQAGDTLICHTTWDALMRLESDRNFVVVTTEYPREEMRPNKVGWASLFFGIALFMVLFTDIRLSVALLTGAVGMILSKVLTIEEAYEAVSWKTVFLLASLIPLGLAVESTGTAKWIAEQTLLVVGDMPIWVIQAAVAVLATFFTLVMSNVGATVLLVPLAVNIAIGAGADPAVFALTVAIATSNSFLIPTHQVNALIMGPGGYRVPDFIRAGGIMTILFLVVSLTMLNLIF
ncbi:MAG: SLC13 family permease [Gammaproteobacteria bacterium]|nr:SLC13 family permease [Gammaproteobacteria bacterium]